METPPAISLINKFEFIVVNVVFAFALYKIMKFVSYGHQLDNYESYSITSNYILPNLFRDITLYGSYLLIRFIAVKNIVAQKQVVWNLLLCVGLFILTALVYGTTDTWLNTYPRYNNGFNFSNLYAALFAKNFMRIFFIYAVYAVYNIIKYPVIIKIIKQIELQPQHAKILRDCAIAALVWLFLLLFLIQLRAPDYFKLFMLFVVSLSIALYGYASISLIPALKQKQKNLAEYELRIALLLSGALLIIYFIIGDLEKFSFVLFFNLIIQLVIAAPVTWYINEYRAKKSMELTGLKTALGQSSANLDFLRSQINPHFLFNALNTLYGTALQENADRTSEGIQKLGDMMRFMLHENNEDRIALNREINYLQNYISLQKLRTQLSPDIIIQIDIDDLSETTGETGTLKIAPMLLIPFVENAFKHGISLREPSHIKISLHITNRQLLFDVNNSIHPQQDKDPEKNKNGIGLENVKQRLKLLYTGKHELVIYKNPLEFYVHLAVTL